MSSEETSHVGSVICARPIRAVFLHWCTILGHEITADRFIYWEPRHSLLVGFTRKQRSHVIVREKYLKGISHRK
jgi:hypothetical protein